MSGVASGRLLWAALSATILLFDQISKAQVRRLLPLHESVTVLPGFVQLTHVTNRGALFGMLHDLPDPWRSALFTLVPLLAIVLILGFQARTPAGARIAHAGLALILGGAAGNLADRLRFGQVTDFVDVFVGAHHWPAFNLADSSICVGVALLVLDLMRHGGRPSEAGEATRSEPCSPSSLS
ncbi:MAG TPA: signal peptidase II [Candidatus Polarisedimenticolia bacterium]|nr:signal peptidase II [Candidatus Polarisedimenticolia bacterium]